MTREDKKRFLSDWVRARAVVILTRRGDLTLSETRRDTGLDLHVRILREDKPMRLTFGVLLRGAWSPMNAERVNRILGPTMGQFQGLRKFTYPVCLFFFTGQDEHAYFAWLAEPVVTDRGPKLVHHEKAACVELTNELLDEVVERVVAWYDAVEAVLIA